MNKRALFAALALLPLFAQAEIKTIKDVLGREVKVDVPVKRAFGVLLSRLYRGNGRGQI